MNICKAQALYVHYKGYSTNNITDLQSSGELNTPPCSLYHLNILLFSDITVANQTFSACFLILFLILSLISADVIVFFEATDGVGL